jgi:hypothetical protein
MARPGGGPLTEDRSNRGAASPKQLAHLGESVQPSLHARRVSGVSRTDAGLECIESPRFAFEETRSIFAFSLAQGAKKRDVRLAGALEPDAPGYGGEGLARFAQGQGFLIGVAPRLRLSRGS